MDPKRSRSQQSAEIIAGNDDLLTELILLHLPAISLIKFKSVSKRWQSLISAPLFGAAHTNHISRRRETLPSFILGTAAEPPEFFYFNPTTRVFLPYTFEYPYTKILQSSHGLLLLACRKTRCGRVHYCVHNPTTNQSRKLEHMRESKNMLTWILGMSLSFDPRTSPYYKIICTRRSPLPCFEIYHSEFDRWEHVPSGDIYRGLLGIRLSKGLSCNNDGIYWIQPTSPESYYFNIRTRHLEKLSGNYAHRRKLRPCSNKNKLLVSNGRVHCVSTYFGPKVKCLIVYELLSDHNSGWIEKCWADLGPFLEVDEGPIGLLGIVRGEKEEYSSVLLLAPEKIICYWFLDRRFEVLCDFTSSEIYKEDDQLQFRSFRVLVTLSYCQFTKNPLCLSNYCQDFKHLTIYELSSDHNSGWVEKFRADLNPFSEMKCPVWLLGIVRGDDKEEYSSILIRARGMIVCYWFFDKRYGVLSKFSSREIFDLQFDTELCHQFIESLVPV